VTDGRPRGANLRIRPERPVNRDDGIPGLFPVSDLVGVSLRSHHERAVTGRPEIERRRRGRSCPWVLDPQGCRSPLGHQARAPQIGKAANASSTRSITIRYGVSVKVMSGDLWIQALIHWALSQSNLHANQGAWQ